jgi:beta-glucanase (GH16 family)
MQPTSYRTLSLLVVGIAAALSLTGCTGDGPRPVHSPMAQQAPVQQPLVWSDEFPANAFPATNGLNMTKWRYETGYGEDGWGNDEWQLYTSDPDNVKVVLRDPTTGDGELVIAARHSGTPGKRDGSITSARITTEYKMNVRFGKIQARIKVPESEATWPAFWGLGGNFRSVGWPRCGEIDIMEVLNRFSDIFTTHATVHWWNEAKNPPNPEPPLLWDFVGGSRSFAEPLSNDYHVYEAERTAENIIFRIDGITVYVRPLDATMSELADEFFLLLNIAIGGTHGADPTPANFPSPQEMRVDWVRIYADPAEVVDPPDPSLADRGIYSETRTNPSLPFDRVINTIDWSGNAAASNLASTDVPPKEGAVSMSVDYQDLGLGYGGPVFQFGDADFTEWAGLTTYEFLVFSLNTSTWPTFGNITIQIEDDTGKQSQLQLTDYDPEIDGDWNTYTIPLTDFNAANPLTDLTKVRYLGFLKIGPDAVGSGIFHLDDIHLAAPGGLIQLRSMSILTGDTSTWVTITDRADETVAVTVGNGTDSISVDVALNSSGHGSAPIHFGATNDATDTISIAAGGTLTASFVDSAGTGSTRTDSAQVVNSRNLADDDDGDGAVFLYATDPSIVIDMVPGVDYGTILEWGSGTTLDGSYMGDTTYQPVFSVSGTTGWGTVIAFNGFAPGFTAPFQTMRFKFKGTSEFILKFATPGAANDIELTFPVADAIYSRALGDDWYEISFRLRDIFGDGAMENANEFAIFRVGGHSFFITDLQFE